MRSETPLAVGRLMMTSGKRLAPVLLAVMLLAVRANALATENLDVIWSIPDSSLEGFGTSLASGDVNGDGVPDLVVAWDTFDSNGGMTPLRGIVNIYYGDHIGETIPDVVLRSPVWKGANAPFLACGDLNGDGYADVVMGEDMADQGAGICTVWFGGNPMDTIPDVIIHGRTVWWLNSHFGYDVSMGDVNGDGYEDLAVGAYSSAERPAEFGTGRVYVFYGGPGFDTLPDVTLRGGHDGDYEGFGSGVSAAGDFDHDGFNDLYIGAWQYGSDSRGRMYVYYGGNPMDTSYDMAMSGEGAGHFLGYEKPGALHAQGNFDYAVEGNELWPHGSYDPGNNCGKVYIHQGGRSMDSIPDISIIGRMDSANLGYSAQSAGDVTGDGNDDLVAGAPYSWPPSAAGAAYLWETGSHFDTVPDAWMMGDAAQQVVGERVCTAGDLNGDGRSEFMVSNYSCNPQQHVWVCNYTGSGVQEEEVVGVRSGPALRVYPSPCRDRVQVNCPLVAGKNSTLSVFDMAGRVVRTLALPQGRSNEPSRAVSWDLRDNAGRRVSQGVYIVELQQYTGSVASCSWAKVIVQGQ